MKRYHMMPICGMEEDEDGLFVLYADIKHLIPEEPKFTLFEPAPKRKKRRKIWIDGQRYKAVKTDGDVYCSKCAFNNDITSCAKAPFTKNVNKSCKDVKLIWKLSPSKPKPLDLDNLPKGFMPDRYKVEYFNGDCWLDTHWESLCELDKFKYRYTKKAPR